MGGMLAMPGPIAAAWMSINGLLKNEIRATIISFFVFAYGVNAALYTVITGVSSKILDEKTFRFIVLGVLICTICTLGLDFFSVHL